MENKLENIIRQKGIKRILIVGSAGSGKTTIIKKIVQMFDNRNIKNMIFNDIVGEMSDVVPDTKVYHIETLQKMNNDIFTKELKDNNLIFDLTKICCEEIINTKKMFFSSYISNILYSIIHSQIRDKGKQSLCFVADGMQGFLYKDSKSPIKDAMKDTYNIGDEYNINTIIAVQSIENIDKDFIHDSNYIFLSAFMSDKEIVTIVYEIFNNNKDNVKVALNILHDLKKHEFLVIDKDNMILTVIKSGN